MLSEADLQSHLPRDASRNSLLNEPVITLDDRDPLRTDILHEYFVAPERFADFVNACRGVIRASSQQLLDVTLGYVDTDHDSVLAYATGPWIAAVMLFSQEQTAAGGADMARMRPPVTKRGGGQNSCGVQRRVVAACISGVPRVTQPVKTSVRQSGADRCRIPASSRSGP